jgi:LCP family protein required for cell wall assembly
MLPAVHRFLSPVAGRVWRHRTALAAQVVAGLISVVVLVVSGYAWGNYRDLDTGLRRLTLDVGQQPSAAPSTPSAGSGSASASSPPATPGRDQNLLAVGTDDRSDLTPAERKKLHVGNDVGVRSDVILIIHLPADGSQATMISIPRDSYVRIPGHGRDRINAAFSFGYNDAKGSHDQKIAAGANLLIHTVENLTGMEIDHFIEVDFIAFFRIAQAIGGVPVVLCHSVDDRYSTNIRNGVRAGSGFHMTKGRHVLTPVQSLEFVRQRHNLPGGSTDLQRNARQRYFLAAAFRSITSAGVLFNPGRLHSLISAVKRSVYVDSGFDLTSLVGQAANLTANKIVGRTIPVGLAGRPGTEFWNDSPVGSVIRVDPPWVRRTIASWLHPAGTAHHRSASGRATKPPDRGCVN